MVQNAANFTGSKQESYNMDSTRTDYDLSVYESVVWEFCWSEVWAYTYVRTYTVWPSTNAGYKVTLSLLTGATTFVTDPDTLSFRLPKPDAAYSVGVQATNSVGSGETLFAVNCELIAWIW